MDRLWPFIAASALVILIPGPATFYVLGKARHATLAAGAATLGIVAGDLVLITISGLGFSALVARYPALLAAVKFGGAAYVAYLGLELLRAPSAVPAQPAAGAGAQAGRGFAQGLLITLTNPKPVLFFAAFFPLFIAPGTHSPMRDFYALGACFEVLNVMYFATLIALTARLRRWPAFGHFLGGRFNAFSGAGLLGCSVLIVASSIW